MSSSPSIQKPRIEISIVHFTLNLCTIHIRTFVFNIYFAEVGVYINTITTTVDILFNIYADQYYTVKRHFLDKILKYNHFKIDHIFLKNISVKV